MLAKLERPQKRGWVKYGKVGLILVGILAVFVGLTILAMNVVRSPGYQPQYQEFQDATAVLKAQALPGSRVKFSSIVDKQAFTQFQDNDKTYPVYQWTEGNQILQARFSSKLKQVPDGKIVINASVQARVGDQLFIFVDSFSQQ